MSYAGVIRKRGSMATQKRATSVTDSVGQSNLTWATISTSLYLLLQELTQIKAQEIFGQDTEAELRADVLQDTDISINDGLIITAGHLSGNNYRVVEKKRPSPDVIALGLRHTEETFA